MKLIARGQDVSACLDVDRIDRVGREIFAYKNEQTDNGLKSQTEQFVGYFNLDGLNGLWINEVKEK